MTKPIIVAVDPRHEDVAPAALGVMFAKVFEAPLLLAATYPVDLSIENLHPAYARALGRDADQAVERVAAQVAASNVSLTTTAVPDGSSPARTLHAPGGGRGRAAPAHRLLAPWSGRARVAHRGDGPAPPRGTLPRRGGSHPLLVEAARPDQRRLCRSSRRTCSPGLSPGRCGAGGCSRADPERRRTPPARIDGVLEPLALEYVRRAREGTAEMALDDGLRALPDDRSAGGRLLSGTAADALARASVDIDLLVCGSRGYGAVRSARVGTTTHALVRHAACPVVVVPHEPHDRR